MLSSIQAGLAALEPGIQAALICLGDQPQMEAATVTTVVAAGKRTGWKRVVAPSYQMRMGHPILLPQTIWPQVMNTTESLRAVLRKQRDKIEYLTVETPTVLADLDTPEDYVASQPTTD